MKWQIDLIKKHPILCTWCSFFEGLVIGLLIYHFFIS